MKPLMYREVYELLGNYPIEVPIDIPDQRFGIWEIETFVVTKEDYKRQVVRSMFQSGPRANRIVPEGTFKRLSNTNSFLSGPMMTNTPDEIKDQMEFMCHAYGNVLINGLGLGVTLKMLFTIGRVDHVTVIEKDQDIFRVIGSHYQKKYGDKLTVINADALEWKPDKGIRYQAVWHDIWPEITADNIKDMKLLHRRYGRRCDWQASWARDFAERQRDHNY